jgi:hypothetical protein
MTNGTPDGLADAPHDDPSTQPKDERLRPVVKRIRAQRVGCGEHQADLRPGDDVAAYVEESARCGAYGWALDKVQSAADVADAIRGVESLRAPGGYVGPLDEAHGRGWDEALDMVLGWLREQDADAAGEL